jgi:hypothetical protein
MRFVMNLIRCNKQQLRFVHELVRKSLVMMVPTASESARRCGPRKMAMWPSWYSWMLTVALTK